MAILVFSQCGLLIGIGLRQQRKPFHSQKKIYISTCLLKTSARTCRYPKMPPLLLSFNCLTGLPILPLFTLSNVYTCIHVYMSTSYTHLTVFFSSYVFTGFACITDLPVLLVGTIYWLHNLLSFLKTSFTSFYCFIGLSFFISFTCITGLSRFSGSTPLLILHNFYHQLSGSILAED